MSKEEVAEKYFQELHDILLSHDEERLAAFYHKWHQPVPSDEALKIMPYVMICNENYFTPEEKAEAEKWLRTHGCERLINKKPLN